MNFKPVKDELRRAIQQAKNQTLFTEPRVSVRDGLAYFDVKDYEDALATHGKLVDSLDRAGAKLASQK